MKSKAQIGGHPLHSMLIAVPMGTLTFALVLDIFVLVYGTQWLDAATLATVFGTAFLALAAIPGFVDYFSVVQKTGEVRRGANQHMTLGLFVATLYIISSGVHLAAWNAAAPGNLLDASFWLNLIGAVMLTVQGWLGAELVYKGRIAVHEGEERAMTRREARARRTHARA